MTALHKRLAVAAATTLAALALPASAAGHDITVVPGTAPIQFERHDGRIDINTDATVDGILQAYWLVTYQDGDTATRSLHLRFFPDTPSLRRLPSVHGASPTLSRPHVINLYAQPPAESFDTTIALEAAIPLLDRVFSTVPREFFRHHEGQASTHARLRITHLSALIECDAFHFFGKLVDVRPLPTRGAADTIQPSRLDTAAPCAQRAPYAEYFLTTSDTGTVLELKAAPESTAATVAIIPGGTVVLKLRSANEHWIEVHTLTPEDIASGRPAPGNPAGYLPATALQAIN